MIGTVLVANRGEIARRIMRTCREMGLGTVAVYAPADADAPHVREAGAAVPLEGDGARAYLRPEALVEAAERAGADAVHPGYGFLSESAAFARAVVKAGLTWVGPPTEAIEAMGSKTAAKELAARAGVPVSSALAPEEVAAGDVPVLVKAAAGGGGRGMRIVRRPADLEGAVEAARAEAAAAFGDPAVFCEPYVERGRHVEVQVLADAHGTVWAVGDRDCSVQRRHQKVVEEAPAPGIGPGLRERLHEAARRMAEAIGYTGAGTAEFLLAEDGEPAFLEMNTRLQVEHPVTECVTGLDLVEWQLRVADGEPLPGGGPPAPRGHAVEARLYAEDPAAGWRPHSGTVARFEVPAARARFAVPGGHGVRVDSGVEAGTRVGVEFDAMLAKVVAWGRDRGDARRRLSAALAGARLHGVGSNRDLLVRVLRHPVFAAGDMHIRFLEQHCSEERGPGEHGPVPDGAAESGAVRDGAAGETAVRDGAAESAVGEGAPELTLPLADARAVRLSALAAALAEAERSREGAPVLGGLPAGWRNLPSAPHTRRYRGPSGEEVGAAYASGRTGPVPVAVEGTGEVRLHGAGPDRVELVVDGVRYAFDVAREPDAVYVDSVLGPVVLEPVSRFPDRASAVPPGTLLAPMPGTVARVAATTGDRVEAGDPVLWLEAMKMEHELRAPVAGVVSEVVEAGTRTDTGTVLAVVDPDGAP